MLPWFTLQQCSYALRLIKERSAALNTEKDDWSHVVRCPISNHVTVIVRLQCFESYPRRSSSKQNPPNYLSAKRCFSSIWHHTRLIARVNYSLTIYNFRHALCGVMSTFEASDVVENELDPKSTPQTLSNSPCQSRAIGESFQVNLINANGSGGTSLQDAFLKFRRNRQVGRLS